MVGPFPWIGLHGKGFLHMYSEISDLDADFGWDGVVGIYPCFEFIPTRCCIPNDPVLSFEERLAAFSTVQ